MIEQKTSQEERPILHCAFCPKNQDEVRLLIGGPQGVHICDECVLLCVDTVFAEYFPVAANGHPRGRPAVVVLPQWNAKEGAQDGLCRLINRFGIVALKLALPYHEERRPPGMRRADFTLSPNVGRTLQSCRQAVLDARAAVSWLEREGHGPIGIVVARKA